MADFIFDSLELIRIPSCNIILPPLFKITLKGYLGYKKSCPHRLLGLFYFEKRSFMMNPQERIDIFLKSPSFGVVGASKNPEKYGNKVLRVYLQNNLRVYPINPKEDTIEGIKCLKDVSDLPDDTKSISVITPPPVTEKVVEAAHKKGIKNIWMQPGAESERAIEMCHQKDINCIADGSCALVVLKYKPN